MAFILVIDDNAQIRLLLREVLEAEGHVVWQASNGLEALHVAQVAFPDLVITDVLMPVKNGLEVTKALHGDSPATRVIAFSGGIADMDFLDVAKSLGSALNMRKPLSIGELVQCGALLQKKEKNINCSAAKRKEKIFTTDTV